MVEVALGCDEYERVTGKRWILTSRGEKKQTGPNECFGQRFGVVFDILVVGFDSKFGRVGSRMVDDERVTAKS
ncbi:unnamed protein product [Calypogeia fissa]